MSAVSTIRLPDRNETHRHTFPKDMFAQPRKEQRRSLFPLLECLNDVSIVFERLLDEFGAQLPRVPGSNGTIRPLSGSIPIRLLTQELQVV